MSITVGLTGMSGAGKTTVSECFARAGYHVINCDKTARDAAKRGSPLIKRLADEFGKDVVNADGELNRGLLADRAFSSRESTEKLNSLMLPYIVSMIKKQIANANSEYVLLDAPTLFESGADKLCDCTVAVTADRDLCAARIVARDGITVQQANDRLSVQHSSEYFAENCTYVIINNGSLADLVSRTEQIISYINER